MLHHRKSTEAQKVTSSAKSKTGISMNIVCSVCFVTMRCSRMLHTGPLSVTHKIRLPLKSAQESSNVQT